MRLRLRGLCCCCACAGASGEVGEGGGARRAAAEAGAESSMRTLEVDAAGDAACMPSTRSLGCSAGQRTSEARGNDKAGLPELDSHHSTAAQTKAAVGALGVRVAHRLTSPTRTKVGGKRGPPRSAPLRVRHRSPLPLPSPLRACTARGHPWTHLSTRAQLPVDSHHGCALALLASLPPSTSLTLSAA